MRYFWCAECSFCHQGRLLIAKFSSTGGLCLYCEECERVWVDPNAADDPRKSSLSLIVEGVGVAFPDEDEIDRAGWSGYKVHSFEGS